MTNESVPAGTPSDGQFLVLFVPTLANPAAPTEAELNATGVVRLTYSITGDGYTHTVTINKITADRLTLPNQLQYDGTETDELSITFPYTNTDADIARLALTRGTKGFIVERPAVANELDPAAGQLVDVMPIQASLALKNAPVKNQELTRTQALNITGKVHRDVEIVA